MGALRYSEMAGLRWGECEWEDNQIYIRRTWGRGSARRTASSWAFPRSKFVK